MAEDGKDEEKQVKEQDEPEEEQDIVLTVAVLAFSCIQANKIGNKQEEERLFNQLMPIYNEHNMISFYKIFQEARNEMIDSDLVSKWEDNVTKLLSENDEKKKSSEENEGDVEVLNAMLERFEILRKSRDFKEASDYAISIKGLTTGKDIDKHLSLLRLALAHSEDDFYRKLAETTKKLIDKGGDWDRRNRFIVYNGVHNFRIRNFELAAKGFLDAISTFTANEIFNYEKLVFYTIISSIVSLNRIDIKDKLIDSPEILQIIDKPELAVLKSFLNSFYECRYNEFFRSLIELMNDFIRKDYYLSLHASYYLRKLRLRAYDQFLQSYQSVKLSTMANAFGVSVEFLDDELSGYIASSSLTCKIDKVNGIVEIHRTNERNSQYHEVIKRGDALLSRIQRLSRVVTY